MTDLSITWTITSMTTEIGQDKVTYGLDDNRIFNHKYMMMKKRCKIINHQSAPILSKLLMYLNIEGNRMRDQFVSGSCCL